MPPRDLDETRASARLPHLDIDILHRRSPDGDAEQILISLQAMPSFEVFGQFLETGNPFAFWARLAETAWAPWFRAMQAWSSLPGIAPPLPAPNAGPPAVRPEAGEPHRDASVV